MMIDWLTLFGGIFLTILGGNIIQTDPSQATLGAIAIVCGWILVWTSFADDDGNGPVGV